MAALRFVVLLLCVGCGLAASAGSPRASEGNGAESNRGSGSRSDDASALQPTSAESELYNLVNEERKRRNLPTFAFDRHLTAAARKHSEALAAARKLSHQLPDEPELKIRLAQAGGRFDAIAENVAKSESVENAHTELMHSPGHRANLLNPVYDTIGIGVVEQGPMIYVTEDFSHRVAEQTVEAVETQIFKSVNQLRSRNGLPALRRADSSSLRQAACKPGLTAAAARRYLTGAGFLVVFTQSDPSAPPDDLKKAATSPTVGTIAIGACYPPESRQGFAMFTALAVLSK